MCRRFTPFSECGEADCNMETRNLIQIQFVKLAIDLTQAGVIEEMVVAAEALLATLDDPAGSHAIRQFSIGTIINPVESCSATHGVSVHGRTVPDTRPALPQLNAGSA